MPRRFFLQTYDSNLNLLDEIELERATNPSGLGFKQKITTVETDTIDYVMHQKVNKQPIKLTVNFTDPDAYLKVRLLRAWIGKNIEKRCVLKYDDGEGRIVEPSSTLYVDIQIEELGLTEKDCGVLSAPLTIKELSPWYIMERKVIKATVSTVSKVYPYTYPYNYGGLSISEKVKTINNTFFKSIPLAVKIKGRVVAPEISLQKNDEIYTTISFPNITIEEGETLEINALDRRISFYRIGDSVGSDYYNHLDHSKDTFLFAEPGINQITVNLDQTITNTDGSKPAVEVIYIQYVV